MEEKFIDLSHIFEDGMPGFRIKDTDGELITYTAKIHPFLTHSQTKEFYEGHASFEITEVSFQTSIGTYLDSPYHRFPDKHDMSEILLKDVILLGIVIDARGLQPFHSFNLDNFPKNIDVVQKAVLFNFGWSQFWGTEQYQTYPFIAEEVIDFLVAQNIKLVGVDTINIDDSRNLSRPAHTKFLGNDILIAENLTNLETLYQKRFRFFAVPLKGKKVAAFPVRAFAEILE